MTSRNRHKANKLRARRRRLYLKIFREVERVLAEQPLLHEKVDNILYKEIEAQYRSLGLKTVVLSDGRIGQVDFRRSEVEVFPDTLRMVFRVPISLPANNIELNLTTP